MRDEAVRHDGLTFEVRDAGPADGDAVVLLHGFPQDSSTWDAVAPRLNDHGLRTLAPDQRGYSPGARPRRRRDYRLPLLVADVVALLDDRGLDRAHLVGHDWGGAVVWGAAATVPDRVASATVLSTPHPAAMASALLGEQGLASWYMGFFQLPLLPEVVLRRTLPGLLARSGVPGPAAERYAARMAEPGALPAALGWYRALPYSRAGVGDSVVPTTYVWGAQDPALRRRAAEGVPGTPIVDSRRSPKASTRSARPRRLPVRRAGRRALAARDPTGRGRRRRARTRGPRVTPATTDLVVRARDGFELAVQARGSLGAPVLLLLAGGGAEPAREVPVTPVPSYPRPGSSADRATAS